MVFRRGVVSVIGHVGRFGVRGDTTWFISGKAESSEGQLSMSKSDGSSLKWADGSNASAWACLIK